MFQPTSKKSELITKDISDEEIDLMLATLDEEIKMSKRVNTETSEVTASDLASIEEGLMDLEIEELEAGATEVEETVEDALAELDVLDETDEQTLETHIARVESYEEQDAGGEVAALEPVKVKKAKAPKEAKEKAPSITRDPANLPESAFVLSVGEDASAERKAEVLGRRPTQKKIAEKFDNVLVSFAAGRAPSVYVMECFRALDAKGEATSSELVAALRATSKKNGGDGYSEGTARSQVGQCMELFKVLEIAKRDKSQLVLNADSVIAAELRKFL